MIIRKRELEEASRFAVRPPPPFLESLGSRAPGQKVRSRPGLGGPKNASGHTEAASPAAGNRAPHHCALQTPVEASGFSARAGRLLLLLPRMLWSGQAALLLYNGSPARGSMGPLHSEGAAGEGWEGGAPRAS